MPSRISRTFKAPKNGGYHHRDHRSKKGREPLAPVKKRIRARYKGRIEEMRIEEEDREARDLFNRI